MNKLKAVAILVPENTEKLIVKSLNWDANSERWGVLEQRYDANDINDMNISVDKYINCDAAKHVIDALDNIIINEDDENESGDEKR